MKLLHSFGKTPVDVGGLVLKAPGVDCEGDGEIVCDVSTAVLEAGEKLTVM